MTKKVDKDQNFMSEEWGTKYLASEYGWDNEIFQISTQKVLREVENESQDDLQNVFNRASFERNVRHLGSHDRNL